MKIIVEFDPSVRKEVIDCSVFMNLLKRRYESYDQSPNTVDNVTELQWRTFDEWSADGYKIKAGSKATVIDGQKKFSDKQVSKKKPAAASKDYSLESDTPF